MILKPELVKRIRDYFNLNIYETKVWLALLGKGISSAGEIAEISGVPRSRTYDVLEGLEKAGFVITKIGKPAKYIAVKPALIIEKLKNNTLKEAEEKVGILSRLKGSHEYGEIEALYNTGIKPVKHEELSGALKGKNTIYNHMRDILENANKEVIVCTSYRDFTDKLRLFTALIERLKKNGIAVKIALSGNDQDIKKLGFKIKEKIKQVNITAKFFIVDREQILFVLAEEAGEDEEMAVWLNAPFFTNSMVYLFDQVWKD